jgi:predicted RNA-binding protein with RPS1 domain
MDLEWGIQGLIHLSEIAHWVVKDIRDHVKVGEEVTAKIINFEPDKKRIWLSLKALKEIPKELLVKEAKRKEKKEKPKEEVIKETKEEVKEETKSEEKGE